jgi:hypothetical protein
MSPATPVTGWSLVHVMLGGLAQDVDRELVDVDGA